jgi:hypothetical protein
LVSTVGDSGCQARELRAPADGVTTVPISRLADGLAVRRAFRRPGQVMWSFVQGALRARRRALFTARHGFEKIEKRLVAIKVLSQVTFLRMILSFGQAH